MEQRCDYLITSVENCAMPMGRLSAADDVIGKVGVFEWDGWRIFLIGHTI